MLDYMLLALSVALAVVNSIILHTFQAKNENAILYNMLMLLVWIVLLPLLEGIALPFTKATLIWGVIYGVVMAGFFVSKTRALTSGPIAPTTIIGSCSLIIPSLIGVILLHESITLSQGIGLGLVIVSLLLSTMVKDSTRIEKKWMLYCVLFFVFSGATGLAMKLHQQTDGKDEVAGMLLISAIVAELILVFFFLRERKPDRQPVVFRTYRGWVLLIICGAVSCLYSWINVYLSGVLPSIVFFPIYNGCVIILSSLAGGILFKERLNRNHRVGILVGIVAILLVGGVISF